MVLNLLNKVEEILQNKWIQRILNNFYYLFMGLILIICFTPYIFNYFGTSYININDAKNVINLLVQSEAAVIAIVITLSLVAVQLAASSYSTRVIDIFKKSYSFWVIVGLYIIAIIYGIILLSVISVKNTYGIQNFIFIDYLIGIIAFISLIGFILITFDLLKPSTVLKKLAQDIKKEKILEYLRNKKEKDDPIQPIMDIIHASLIKYDYMTLREGLEYIGNQYNKILYNGSNEEEKIKITKHILKHLKRAGDFAISKRDDDSFKLIIIQILKIGNWATETKNEKIMTIIVKLLKDMADLAIEQNIDISVQKIASSLGVIGKLSIENNLNDKTLKEIINALENIGKIAIAKKLDIATGGVALSYGKIGEAAIKHENKNISMLIIVLISEIGNNAILEELDVTKQHVTYSLVDIGKSIMNTERDLLYTLNILSTFDKFLKTAIDNKSSFDSLIFKCYMDVAEMAIINGFDKETIYIFESILEIRKNAKRQKLDTITILIHAYLGNFFKIGVNHGNGSAIDLSIKYLIEIGKSSKNEDYIIKRPLIYSLKEILKMMEFFKKVVPTTLFDDLINEIIVIINDLNQNMFPPV